MTGSYSESILVDLLESSVFGTKILSCPLNKIKKRTFCLRPMCICSSHCCVRSKENLFAYSQNYRALREDCFKDFVIAKRWECGRRRWLGILSI